MNTCLSYLLQGVESQGDVKYWQYYEGSDCAGMKIKPAFVLDIT